MKGIIEHSEIFYIDLTPVNNRDGSQLVTTEAFTEVISTIPPVVKYHNFVCSKAFEGEYFYAF